MGIPSAVSAQSPERLEVSFHAGNVITLLSQVYGSGTLVLREAFQNAIDEGARNIFALIDCAANSIKVFDDGRGAGVEAIKRKFANIGQSLKAHNPAQIGKLGIGNLAGLSVARLWRLITAETAKLASYYAFTFDSKELGKSSSLAVECERLDWHGVNCPAGFKAVTLLQLVDVSEIAIQQLGDRVAVERTLQEAFASQLRQLKINMRICYRSTKKGKSEDYMVHAPLFRGVKMDPVEYETPPGKVEFRLFQSPMPLDKPRFLVQNKGVTTIPLSNFFMLGILPKELERFFTSGHFEGEILLGFCTPDASRTSFKQDAELPVFVETIAKFVRQVLQPLTEQLEQANRDERLREVADRVVKRMKAFLQKNLNLIPASLKAMLFRKSNEIITGPVPPVLSGQKLRQPKLKEPVLPSDATVKQKEKSERPADKAPVVRKARVLESALGINFVFPDPTEGSCDWHSRTNGGIFEINVVHPDFCRAEQHGKALLGKYMQVLVQKELVCASLPPMEAAAFNQAFETRYLPFCQPTMLE